MPTLYAIYDTATGSFYGSASTSESQINEATAILNEARKPEFQTFTVVTVSYDPQPVEKDFSDAPALYSASEASAWAAGYNAAQKGI